MIRPGRAKGPYVGDTGAGTSDPLAGGILKTIPGIPAFQDDFTEATLKPFWRDTQVLLDGDWVFSAANDRLEGGGAENNPYDYYRYGIEGDLDHAIKCERNGSTSVGLEFYNTDETLVFAILMTSSKIIARRTGETDVQVDSPGGIVWLRALRILTTLYFYYKINDTDDWILVHSDTNKNYGWQVNAALDSAANGRIYQVIFHDNSWSNQIRSKAQKWIQLTDGATIAVDASLGNFFTVELAGNRTLGNPSNSRIGQMIIFRIKQDSTGSRTLSFDTDYNFGTGLPSPVISATGNHWDYLGFIYNESTTKWDYIAEALDFS